MISDPSTLASFQEKLRTGHRSPANAERIEAAFRLAKELYAERQHWAGMSLMEHALGVLEVLLGFEADDDAIVACLLQHTLETKTMTLQEIEARFGHSVRQMISSIHLLSHVTMRNRRSSIEDLRLMLLNVSDDMRVILIVLCERCFILEHANIPPADLKRECRDVLGLFAPVAARLGIHTLKQRLEGLAFPVLYPLDSQKVTEELGQTHTKVGDFLTVAASLLEYALQEQGIQATVYGREKHPYSIFSKMRTKSVSHITRLPDLFALRVIVHTVEECYTVLGLLHRMGRPVANRFKDYIAFPKPNGYQSLHTTVMKLPGVPDGVSIEVQIRTRSMHREAEYGIAAHWNYKEGGSTAQSAQRFQLQQMLQKQEAVLEGKKTSLVDHIFVLTPQGDLVELPEGATPLDFAFQIHTDLGLSFKGARVNGRIVPSSYVLENGDTVEILRHKTPKPSTEWMQQLAMASSRSKLRHYLHLQHRTQYIAEGRQMLNEALASYHLPPLDTDLSVLRLCDGKILSKLEREDMLMKIGQGTEKLSLLLPRIAALRYLFEEEKEEASLQGTRRIPSVEFEAHMNMPYKFAKCCKPQEKMQQSIVGFVTRNGEVSIHQKQCRMVKHANPERRVRVKWK
jgi:GTP pyrophosphokinase